METSTGCMKETKLLEVWNHVLNNIYTAKKPSTI